MSWKPSKCVSLRCVFGWLRVVPHGPGSTSSTVKQRGTEQLLLKSLHYTTIRRLRWHDTWRHTEGYSKLSFLACVFCSKLQQDLLKHGVRWDKIGVFISQERQVWSLPWIRRPPPSHAARKYSPRHVPVKSRSCPSYVSVLSRWCLNHVPILSRWCLGHILILCLGPSTVMSGWCPSHSDVMFRWCPGQYYGDVNVSVVRRCRCSHIAFMFGWFLGHFPILFQWCRGHILILCLVPVQQCLDDAPVIVMWCFGDVPANITVMSISQSCAGVIVVTLRLCLGGFSAISRSCSSDVAAISWSCVLFQYSNVWMMPQS